MLNCRTSCLNLSSKEAVHICMQCILLSVPEMKLVGAIRIYSGNSGSVCKHTLNILVVENLRSVASIEGEA